MRFYLEDCLISFEIVIIYETERESGGDSVDDPSDDDYGCVEGTIV